MFKKDHERLLQENLSFIEIYLKKLISTKEKEALSETGTTTKKHLSATNNKEKTTEKKSNNAFDFSDKALLSDPLNLSNVMMNEKEPTLLSTIKKSKK